MTADTAKCAGNGCPIRESCDRFVRPAVDRQTWLEPTWAEVPPTTEGLLAHLKINRWYVCNDRLAIEVKAHGGAVEEGDGA